MLIRFFHWLGSHEKRFEKVTITFPIRVHSYLECHRNTGLVNTLTTAEVPSNWWDVFKAARKKHFHFSWQDDFKFFLKI